MNLPSLGVSISAPYAYQTGAYNLIDPMRIPSNPELAIEKAGAKAIEGQWLRKQAVHAPRPRQLVVVGEFGDEADPLYPAIQQMMSDHYVKLFRMDDLDSLISDIRHSKSSPPR